MRCEDVQLDLALFAGGSPSNGDQTVLNEHLAACPLCRQSLDDLQDIRLGLQRLTRPQIPGPVLNSIREAVRATAQPVRPVYGLLNPGAEVRSYRLLLMSYVVGACASLVLGLTFISLVLSSGTTGRSGPMTASSSRVMLTNSSPGLDISRLDLSAKDYANTRSDIAAVSPSVNPQGSLIDLTRSLVSGDLKDDEVVVVADVFENGSAQIAEVVEPSRNHNAVGELARALDYESTNTPFVPATMDQRSDTIRVVLKIQSVNVSTKERPRRTRL